MNARQVGRAFLVPLALIGLACDDDPVEPELPAPLAIVPSTPPGNLLENIETIYNATGRSATERLTEYEKLFLHGSDDPPVPGFTFYFQEGFGHGLPPSWGLSEELEAHRMIFTAQADSAIYSLHLRITHGATEPIEGDPGRVDWEEIFATNVYLRLLFNPNDGLEVNGGQAEFRFAPDTTKPPADGGRFYGGYWIAEWTDLPRPAPLAPPAVEPATWGAIKAAYSP